MSLPPSSLAGSLMLALVLATGTSHAADAKPAEKSADAAKPAQTSTTDFRSQPQTSVSDGSVTIGGKRVDYKAVAGTLVLRKHGTVHGDPELSMFYVAYFKQGVPSASRPITFLYNGGPGSATVWLHMGAFGPRRVVTRDDSHTPPAPYQLVDNADSLLDVSDLVFIDAPGAGFSRLIADGDDQAKQDASMAARKKQVYGVDGDGEAFADFITQFLSRWQRWNSPKYLFGESYGTTRSAVLANLLENEKSVDLNGVILLSQILSFDNSIDGPEFNPGIDQPYALALPTFAATAWYHKRLPQQPPQLEPFLHEVEQYAMGDYMQALLAGDQLDPARKQQVAERLHAYTGLPVDYLLRANLRVSGGMFEQQLQLSDDLTTGRLDSRFSGPAIDPMAKSADYDPQSSAISSAYVSTFNDYVRTQLHFGDKQTYRLFADIQHWDFNHHQPGAGEALQSSTNVMPDLAMAMKTNPDLKVLVAGGYYDLATPYFAARYEMAHLPIAASLQKNIEFAWFPSGHMVYAHAPSLAALHDRVAAFIRSTDRQSQ